MMDVFDLIVLLAAFSSYRCEAETPPIIKTLLPLLLLAAGIVARSPTASQTDLTRTNRILELRGNLHPWLRPHPPPPQRALSPLWPSYQLTKTKLPLVPTPSSLSSPELSKRFKEKQQERRPPKTYRTKLHSTTKLILNVRASQSFVFRHHRDLS
jgi:hypothetical protein